jgi:predicted AAA+ superfamily ATPase
MKRAYESLLKEYLSIFPCVALLGPRQCGKTTFLREQIAVKGWKLLDMERRSDFDTIMRDPDLFLRLNPGDVAIDEAQRIPDLFPALRVAIDADRKRKGRFIITGSSSPGLLRAVSESLAGRIGIIEMAPFSFAEITHRNKSPFFNAFSAKNPGPEHFRNLKPQADIVRAHHYWFRGGYPEPWLMKKPRAVQVWMDQYVNTYIERDISKLFPGLNFERFRQFIQMLASLSGTIVNYSETARALGVNYMTVRDYFEIAHGSFLWRTIPSYEKNAMKRIVKHPRGHLRDFGLLNHLLRIADQEMLLGHPRAGNFWEGVVVEEILRGLACRGVSHDYYYYRTHAGAEIDLVLEGRFGCIPIEIKYGQTVDPRALRSLSDFIAERECPVGIVINNDEECRQYDEKIIGVPFTCL